MNKDNNRKYPIGYTIYFITSTILFLIFWLYFKNEWYWSLFGGFLLGIAATYIIVVVHTIIEKNK